MDNKNKQDVSNKGDIDKQDTSDLSYLKKLLELNLKKNQEILEISKATKKYIKLQQIWSFVRFLLIVIPIILGFIYLPPILRGFIDNYRSLLK